MWNNHSLNFKSGIDPVVTGDNMQLAGANSRLRSEGSKPSLGVDLYLYGCFVIYLNPYMGTCETDNPFHNCVEWYSRKKVDSHKSINYKGSYFFKKKITAAIIKSRIE